MMSFMLTQEFIDTQAADLSASHWAVMVVLCRHADDSGQSCYPALKTISEKARINIKTARNAIRALADHQWIVVHRSRNGTMSYTINVDKIKQGMEFDEGTNFGTHVELSEGTENGIYRVPKTEGSGVPKTAPKENKEKNIKKDTVPKTTSVKTGIRHSDFTTVDFYKLAQAIFRSKSMTSRIGSIWVSRDGKLNVEAFATALYADERVFEQYKPILEEARASMTTGRH